MLACQSDGSSLRPRRDRRCDARGVDLQRQNVTARGATRPLCSQPTAQHRQDAAHRNFQECVHGPDNFGKFAGKTYFELFVAHSIILDPTNAESATLSDDPEAEAYWDSVGIERGDYVGNGEGCMMKLDSCEAIVVN